MAGRVPDAAPDAGVSAAAGVPYDRIAGLRPASPSPVFVALDGRSGAGKSTVANLVGARAAALVIDGDDFYRGGDDAFWDATGPAEKVDLVIDWRRQRDPLERLRRGEHARWRPYDWEADDGRLAVEITAGPADVVILDGATARDRSWQTSSPCALLHVPRDVRRERLLRREGERDRAEWEARWGDAEDLYFETLMPSDGFDLVLDGS